MLSSAVGCGSKAPVDKQGGARLLAAVVVNGGGGGSRERLMPVSPAILTSFEVRLPLGVYPGQVVFGAGESLKLADDIRLLEPDQRRASAANSGTASAELGVAGEVEDIWSASGVFLRDRSHVFCSVASEGAVTQQNQVRVDGAIEQNVDLGFRVGASWTVTFSPPIRDVRLEPNQSAVLSPGSYGHLHAKSRSRVTLATPGRYLFRSFFIEPQATFVLRNAAGPVYVFVRGTTFTWRGTMQKQNPNAHNVLFGFMGVEDTVIDAPFIGTIVAPNSKVNLISTSAGHTGAFFARAIDTAQPRMSIVHQMFNPGVCAPGSEVCNVGFGCVDNNGNDVPDCRECPGGTAPGNPPGAGFAWTPPPDPLAPHVMGISAEPNRLQLASLEDRTVGAPVQFPARSVPILGLCAGDFDDSGFADIAMLEGDCTALKWFRRVNSAPGRYDLDAPLTISSEPFLRTARHLSCGDFDGDGFDDIFLTTTPQGHLNAFSFELLSNNGNGTQFARSSAQPAFSQVSVVDQALADFDQDGLPDLVVALRKNDACGDTLEVFRNNRRSGMPFDTTATSSSGLKAFVPRHTDVDALTAGDFDGDCQADLWVLAGADLYFLKGNGDFSFGMPVFVQRLTHVKGDVDLDHLDIDSDGEQDLLIATGGTLRWFRGDGAGAVSSIGGTVDWGRKVSVWQRGCVR